LESHHSINRQSARAYMDEHLRHWSATSEPYTSADILQQYLSTGWEIKNPVIIETVYHANNRHSRLYRFTLRQNGTTVEMPVLATPVVFRVVEENDLETVETSRDSSAFA